jgi:acetyltransferase
VVRGLRQAAELRIATLLDGARGEAPVSKDLLAEAICHFAQLAVDATDVAELEVNPLVAGPDGVVAVDARAHMR